MEISTIKSKEILKTKEIIHKKHVIASSVLQKEVTEGERISNQNNIEQESSAGVLWSFGKCMAVEWQDTLREFMTVTGGSSSGLGQFLPAVSWLRPANCTCKCLGGWRG